jgi:hypothetical protein
VHIVSLEVGQALGYLALALDLDLVSRCNAVRQPSQSVRMFGKALTMEKFAIPTSTGAQPPAMTMSIDGAW